MIFDTIIIVVKIKKKKKKSSLSQTLMDVTNYICMIY